MIHVERDQGLQRPSEAHSTASPMSAQSTAVFKTEKGGWKHGTCSKGAKKQLFEF